MPYKPRRPCAYSNCSKYAEGGEQYCTEHKKHMDRHYNQYQRDPECNKRYDKAWKRIRDRYIKDHPLCEECLRDGRLTPAEIVHHKVELSAGGTHDRENLCSLCKHHHSSIHLTKRNRTGTE